MELHDYASKASLDQLAGVKKLRQTLPFDRDFVTRLDRVQELGEVIQPTVGHRGCVNALAWSHTGQLLASGSDDFACCLWRLGAAPDAFDPVNDVEGHVPSLGISLESKIWTGHRRNIFAVKFAAGSEERLFTCAGDATVRVFDLNQAATGSLQSSSGSTWTEYSSASCQIRQFNCHSSRAKRIQTEENAPDVFLTCSEDGTVRQHDLRTSHTCGRQCPPPLADYSASMELYSMTLAKHRPELFVCAGTSPYAYLHDRRFGRQIEAEWGVPPQSRQLSQCVRKFTIPECSGDNKHITACKISDDARDLLVSWSDGPVALFDVFGEPDDVLEKDEEIQKDRASVHKRKRSSRDSDHTHTHKRTANMSESIQSQKEAEPSRSDQIDDNHSSHSAQQEEDFELSDPEIEEEDLQQTRSESNSDVVSEGAAGEEDEDDPEEETAEESDVMSEEEEEDSEIDYDPLPTRFSRRQRDPCPNVPGSSRAVQLYHGHCNSRTVKDVNFVLGFDKVASGSDDGHLFIWDKKTAELLNILKGDDEVVNVIQTHPYLPVVACSGIDNTIKIFEPSSSPPRRFSNLDDRDDIIRSNAVRLEEGGPAAFIPVSALIRLLSRPDRDTGEVDEINRLSREDLRQLARQEDCVIA